MLSDSPPERDVIWTEAGVEGAHRFVQRVWRLVSDGGRNARRASSRQAGTEGEAVAISKAAHKTLKAVGEDIEQTRASTRRLRASTNWSMRCSRAAREVAAGKADAGAARRAAGRRWNSWSC